MALAAVLGPLVLTVQLFLAGASSNPCDEYAIIAELDYCGQSCPSSCEEAEEENAVCRCDSECERYGDCCSPQSGRLNCDGGEQRAQPLAGLQCRSIHLDSRTQAERMEAFWMVSACPEGWPANEHDKVQRETNENCRYGSETLPPVTDLDDGVVYKNEYCAVCHQVTNIQPWGYRFACAPCLKDKLATLDTNGTRKLIEQECISCGFHIPQTGPPPRHCLHDSLVIDECLARVELQNKTGRSWEEDVYRDMVTQCQTGPVRPVATSPCNYPPYYRNQYCAICNAVKTADLSCGYPYANPFDRLDYCLGGVFPNVCDLLEEDESDSARSHEPSRSGRDTAPGDPQPSAGDRSTEADRIVYPVPGSHDYTRSVENTTTEQPTLTLICGPTFIGYASFSLFLDVQGDSGVITSDTVSSNITTYCPSGRVFDPIDQTCRQTLCPEGFATIRGPCSIVLKLANTSNDSLLMCDEGLIALHESEFELLDSDTLLFRNDTFEIVGYNDSSPVICSNFSQNETSLRSVTVFYYSYTPVIFVLTYVGCSLSVVGCILVLLTYSLFKELRTLPGQILMNLVSTILATCLFLLVGIPVAVQAERDALCEATAILLHWLILSQFSWMSVMSFELLRTFYRATHLHPVEGKSTKNKIFLLYFLIGWGIPLLIAVVSLLVNYTTDVIQYGRDGFCWIGHNPSFYVVFLAPVALSIVFNGITFVISLTLLFKASRAQTKLKKHKNISYFRIYLSVFSITGLTWIFGFLAILIRDDWAWYSFIILTSTQGLVIAVAFIFTQKVGGLYKNLLFTSLDSITSFRSSSKQSTKETSGMSDNGRELAIIMTSALTQGGTKPKDEVTENTGKEKNGVSIKMDV